MAIDDHPRVECADREAWRAWLAENPHAAGAWLVLPRRSVDPGPSYAEAVEEALCFGWIDGRQRPLDGARTLNHFAPRKIGGTWARSNKERVERLEREGRMTDAGRRVIAAAKADGSWHALDDIDALVIPADLAGALAAHPAAEERFAAFSASVKRLYLGWIAQAKRDETRRQRIADTVWLAERGIREPRRVDRGAGG